MQTSFIPFSPFIYSFRFIWVHFDSLTRLATPTDQLAKEEHTVSSLTHIQLESFYFGGKLPLHFVFPLCALPFLSLVCRLCPWQLSCHQCPSSFVPPCVPFWPCQCTFTTFAHQCRCWVLSWSTGALHTLFHSEGRGLCLHLREPNACQTLVVLHYSLSNLFICLLMNMFESASDELLPPQCSKSTGTAIAHRRMVLQLWPPLGTLFFLSFQCLFSFFFLSKVLWSLLLQKLQVADSDLIPLPLKWRVLIAFAICSMNNNCHCVS